MTERRVEVLPITDEERAERRARCGTLLSGNGFDAMLVEPGATLEYLTGVSWGLSERLFALLLTADGESLWICPAFEVERARLAIDDGETIIEWQEHEYAYRPLVAELRRRGLERVAVEPALRSIFTAGIARELGVPTLPLADRILLELRGVKDEHELAIMRRASELTREALIEVGELLRPGMTSSRIAEAVVKAQTERGLCDVWQLVLLGEEAACPHGATGERELSRGMSLLIDTGGSLLGYQSDCTRSWVFDGEPSVHYETVWNAVRDVEREVFEAVRPGLCCGELDRLARRAFERRELGGGYENFHHRLGHGIGMEGHEAPYFDGGSEIVLEPGMTVTDEPGIYLPGEFGVRIEDVIAVTEEGAEHFGEWQQGPRSPV
jgi:Xaa-Pro dipeptidase